MAREGGWPRLPCRVSGIFLLLICPAFVSSCSRSDKGGLQTPQGVAQPAETAGAVPVQIAPEAPTSSDPLYAMVSGPGPFSYAWEKNGSAIEGETSPRLSPGRFGRHDRITAVVFSCGVKGSATVVIGKPAPRIVSVSFHPGEIRSGIDIIAVPSSPDPEGDEVKFSYRWSVNGELLSDDTPVLKGDRFKAGDKVSLVVVPSDGAKVGAPYQTASVTVAKGTPWFDSTPSPEFSGATYTYQALARDPEGARLTYSLASAPRGMTVDAGSGMITWPVTSGDSGTHLIQVIAHNPDGAQAMQRYAVTIRLNGGTVQ